MTFNGRWLALCLLWGGCGAALLYALDGHVAGGAAWLTLAVLAGCQGRLFLERLVELIPRKGRALPGDPLFILPLTGGLPGLLLGPFLAAGVAPALDLAGWQGALLGGVLGPPACSLLLLGPTCLARRGKTWPASSDPLAAAHKSVLLLLCAAFPLVLLAALARRLAWPLRRRRRLRVYELLRRRGCVFDADAGRDRYSGVRLAGDPELALLAAFPEMDSVVASGPGVSDAGLAAACRLSGLRLLQLPGTLVTSAGLAPVSRLHDLLFVGLSGTQVDDAGLAALRGLGKLLHLDLRGTRVTAAGVEGLLRSLPDLRVDV